MDLCIPRNTRECRYGSYATSLAPSAALNACISELSAARRGHLLSDLLNLWAVKWLQSGDVWKGLRWSRRNGRADIMIAEIMSGR